MQEPALEIDGARRPPLGMPPARFLRDWWQKRPLLIRAAFPGFTAPLTPEDLAGLACEPYALARLVEHERSTDRWHVRHGPFEEAVFPALANRDWTLLVQDVDKWDPDVRALLPHFGFLPEWRIDDVMVSYAAPGGSVGAHVDQYDVFLLQAQGRRRWDLDLRPQAPLALRGDVELKLLERFEPSHSFELAPGDMLYLPPGIPHHGIAIDACLTCSVGMRAPSAAELLLDHAEWTAERLPDSDRYADPDLAPARSPGEIDADALTRVAATLAAAQQESPDALREWFGRYITRYRVAGDPVPPARTPTLQALRGRIEAGAALHRHPYARLAWTRDGRNARVFVNGEGHDASIASARVLCSAATLDGEALAPLDAAGWQLVHDLVRLGALVPGRGPPKR